MLKVGEESGGGSMFRMGLPTPCSMSPSFRGDGLLMLFYYYWFCLL